MLRYLNIWTLLRHLWRQRALIGQMARRDIQSRYRGSILGMLWSLATPLTLLAIYTFVFGFVFQAKWPERHSDGLGALALILFCGLIPYTIFAECLGRAGTLIVSNPNFVKKVVFPLEMLPVIALLTALYQAGISLLVLLAADLILARHISMTLPLLPIVVLPLLCLTLGICWFAASLGVFIRDIPQAIGVFLQFLFFATPIFYPVTAIPERFRGIVSLNPLAPAIADVRRVALWDQFPDWGLFGLELAISLVCMMAGYAWFMRTRRAFADVI
jgi:lipopolysaccharide transport system permease protein